MLEIKFKRLDNSVNSFSFVKHFQNTINGVEIKDLIKSEIENRQCYQNSVIDRICFFDDEFKEDIDINESDTFNSKQKISIYLNEV